MKKLIVVTGASSGIGMALAKRFSALGHPLLLLARRLKPMQEMGLPHCLCRSVDVTDAAAMEAAIRQAEQEFGKVDCLINCAGLMLLGDAAVQSLDEWNCMIDVNIKGILTGIHAVIENMKARREGTIINISSIAGRKTFDSHSIYCGTKYAVHAISEAMRKELSDSNVRVLVIAPGVVETPLLSHTSSESIKSSYEDWKKSIGGGLTPDTIADCVAFAYGMPQDISVREIVIAKTGQAD